MIAVLVSSFKFELPNKPIVWNYAMVMYSTAGADSKKQEMPLKVSLARH